MIRRLNLHRNPGLEIVWLEKGHLTWQVEGRLEVVRPNSVFFTLPWQTHGSAAEYEPGHRWHFLVIRLLKTDLQKPGGFHFPEAMGMDRKETAHVVSLLRHAVHHALAAGDLLGNWIRELSVKQAQPALLDNRREAALATLIVVELARLLEQPRRARPATMDQYRIQRVIQAVHKNPAAAWSLQDGTRLAGLGKSRFCECFTRETGDTFIRYIHRQRIEVARQRLRRTDDSITTIAHDCGFSSSQYFARIFQNYCGVSATRFRQADRRQIETDYSRKPLRNLKK